MGIQRQEDLENRVPDIRHQGRIIQFIFPIRLLRPHDLLWLELRFKNFKMENKRLVKTADPALMMVTFQPQAIAEEAGTEQESGITLPNLPARMMISNESRLVFRIKKDVIHLTAADLLNWTEHELEVNIRAQEPSKPRPIIRGTGSVKFQSILQKLNTLSLSRINNVKGLSPAEKMMLRDKIGMAPATDLTAQLQQAATKLLLKRMGPPSKWQTSLEVPFRLFLSPTRSGGWINAIKLAEGEGVRTPANKLYELWHTRLGIRTNKGIDESDDRADEKYLRVLWGEKIDEKYNPEPPIPETSADAHIRVTSINDRQRHNLVHLTSNYGINGFTPIPVTAYKLFLTTLGASLDSLYTAKFKQIEKAAPLSLLNWRHIQSLAREHYVEIAEAGFILPFAHEAVKITITERKANLNTFTATNLRREFILITQPVKEYEYFSNNVFRNFCFSSVEVLNLVSPLLEENKKGVSNQLQKGLQFIVMSDNKEVIFEFSANDLNGNTVNFRMPLVWASWELLSNPTERKILLDAYNLGWVAAYTDMNGQKVSLAPEEINGCDTAFAAYATSFRVSDNKVTEPQGFLPVLRDTNIIEPSYQRLTGKLQTVRVAMEPDNNLGKVFARVLEGGGVNFSGFADRSGGLAVPNFDFMGLSKAAGAFGGDIEKVKAATSTAQDFFNAGSVPDPVLFGVFKLSDILSVANGASAYNLGAKAVNRAIPNLSTEETATEIISTYVLKPTLKPVTIEDVVKFNPNAGSLFSILTEARVNKQSGATSFSTDAQLKNVDIVLFGKLVTVQFDEVRFTASAGKSADIEVKMKDPALLFGGPLTFINTLQRLIPDDGFSDPPYLDVSATGVKCGYSLGVPNLQLGAFTLSNIGLGAQVNLPFSGGPMTLGFRFCEKQQPFNLTVSLLGGGGYFGLEADLRGIRQIDAALEFGAAVALNLGVASGSVSIMAGIYFKMIIETNETSTQLTGYLRINGSMSILGLISASIELYMAFTYLSGKNKAYGEASISIKVEVLCFSKTVTVRATRTFAGSGSDPNFQLTYTEDKWKEYCEAFAA